MSCHNVKTASLNHIQTILADYSDWFVNLVTLRKHEWHDRWNTVNIVEYKYIYGNQKDLSVKKESSPMFENKMTLYVITNEIILSNIFLTQIIFLVCLLIVRLLLWLLYYDWQSSTDNRTALAELLYHINNSLWRLSKLLYSVVLFQRCLFKWGSVCTTCVCVWFSSALFVSSHNIW